MCLSACVRMLVCNEEQTRVFLCLSAAAVSCRSAGQVKGLANQSRACSRLLFPSSCCKACHAGVQPRQHWGSSLAMHEACLGSTYCAL